MLFTRHFFINNKHLGTASIGYAKVQEEYRIPWGYAFLCPTCGEVWARTPVDHPKSKFQAITRGCPKHKQHEIEVPGSLWLDWDRDFTKSFPFDALLYEVTLHLQQFLPEQESTV